VDLPGALEVSVTPRMWPAQVNDPGTVDAFRIVVTVKTNDYVPSGGLGCTCGLCDSNVKGIKERIDLPPV
jgi:hypothetical protein